MKYLFVLFLFLPTSLMAQNKVKKMPGHMGAVNCTVQNLSVVMVDGERGILVLRGAIPGPKGGVVTVENSVKAAK